MYVGVSLNRQLLQPLHSLELYRTLAVSSRPPAGDLSRCALYCLGLAGLCKEFY